MSARPMKVWFTCGCEDCADENNVVSKEWLRRVYEVPAPPPRELAHLSDYVGFGRLAEDACANLPAGSYVYFDRSRVDAITLLGELA